MKAIFSKVHDTETGALAYNNEAELDGIVRIAYFSAREFYDIQREDKSGKGFVDFIFYPKDPLQDALIIEVKVNDTAFNAMKQIKEKKYIARFEGKLGEKPFYKGRVLGVAHAYDKEAKTHECLIEVLRERI